MPTPRPTCSGGALSTRICAGGKRHAGFAHLSFKVIDELYDARGVRALDRATTTRARPGDRSPATSIIKPDAAKLPARLWSPAQEAKVQAARGSNAHDEGSSLRAIDSGLNRSRAVVRFHVRAGATG